MGVERTQRISSADGWESAGESPRRAGRPREDRFARRLEIYLDVLPLLQAEGCRGVRMEAAAKRAHMSLGGLRHYFPSRDDLLFFPLLPESCDAAYQSRVRDQGYRVLPPDRFLDWFLESFAEGAMLARVASHMAVDAGDRFFTALANQHPTSDWVEFRRAVNEVGGHSRTEDAIWIARFLRREFVAATLDERATAGEFALDLRFALGVAR